MIRIGVISDTHFQDLGAGLEFFTDLCRGPFADVETILHAGDLVHPDLLACFDEKPVIGVRGNCDDAVSGLPERRILETAGFHIGLVHGYGSPDLIEENARASFAAEQIDVLVFGHSHYPCCRRQRDLLLFNPGSPTDRREAPFRSVGILELSDTVRGKIINLDSAGSTAADLYGVCS